MEALTLQSFEKEWVIKIDKSQFPPEFVIKMLKRLRLEWLAKQAAFDPSLADSLAAEMEESWWEKNKQQFIQ
jgi:hypothetical protein